MKNASLFCCLWIAGSIAPTLAGAGVIRGVVRAATAGSKATAALSRAERARVQEAVVYLEAIPEKVEKKLARNQEVVRVGQAYGRFIPATTAVAAGTTVEFENQDRVYHNAFSVSSAKRFDLGKYAPRESRKVTFERTGVIKLFCDIDPDETGYVLVTPNRAFVQPDSTGAFEFPKLPAGKYKLRVWHPTRSKIGRDVEMPKKGDVVVELRI